MPPSDDKPKRKYDASSRRAAAAQRRLTVVAAARDAFEERGWAGTRLQDVSAAAGVSLKTVEALFGTKATLLGAAVDYAIRGDIEPTPVAQRERVREMEQAADAASMLGLHARHLRVINPRSARIAAVVEHAAAADVDVDRLWQQMSENRRYAVEWATETYSSKRGRRRGLRHEEVTSIFWIAIDWHTYRTLCGAGGLDQDAYEAWLNRYYEALLLER